ncbi:MAG: hypothetical protein L3J13_09560 [Devosiaceae bacterium]|nr:hypothetical protein [Devosiaceae bacterium]
MPIVKSIFWLGVAFVVIGPQIDYQGSASSISNQAINAGQQLLVEQTNVATCSTIECLGTKMAVSAGVKAIEDFLEPASNTNNTTSQTMNDFSTTALLVPKPRARISRSG